jgi:hypothetical protein
MLADEKALSQVLGQVVNRQADPESDKDPKATCGGLLGQSNCGLSQSELYKAIVACAQLDHVEKRCAKGFGAFAARLRAL